MFVIDASVMASWCFPDESDPNAEAAFTRIAVESAVAPTLLWFEVRNILLVGERRKRLTVADTAAFLQHAAILPIDVDHELDGSVVLALARNHGLTVYDAAYLELALRKAAPLATLDMALAKAAKAINVPLVGSD